jgi:hypothetical protein
MPFSFTVGMALPHALSRTSEPGGFLDIAVICSFPANFEHNPFGVPVPPMRMGGDLRFCGPP